MASFVPPGIAGLLGFGSQSWEDRIKEAAYTSPGGTRIRFDFEDVRRETEKRTTAFSFPGLNEQYVQDNGYGSRKYPLRCFFWGSEHDRIATAFEAALLEKGVGKLEHPLYGTFQVIPFGTITRRDDLKTAANQTIVEVTFWTTLRAIYPTDQANPRNEILDALIGFDVAAAQQFQDSTSLLSTVQKVDMRATVRGFLRGVSAALQSVSDATTAVNREFRDLQSTVNLGLDVLVGQPLLLAQQVSNLIKAPARALAGIQSRLDAYAGLADSIFGSSAGSPGDALTSGTGLALLTTKVANDFHASDLFAMNAVGGSVRSTVENQFDTKPEALAAAESVLSQFDDAITWREAGFGDLSTIDDIGEYQVDTGGSYQALHRAVSLAAGFLVEISFSLVAERRIVLDRPRTIIDLSAELYGSVENDRLDFMINSNSLTGDEILELPRGKLIRYYPTA